jgi:ribosomal protein L11 methyltransferase
MAATALEVVSVVVPDEAVAAYEAALQSSCGNVAMWLDEDTGLWCLEAVRAAGRNGLEDALALAAAASGTHAVATRAPTPAEGWLARTQAAFPEQRVGRRFAVRGTHLEGMSAPGRITLRLDAGVAFGSGEHGSTRGCLRALELIVRAHQARRIIDFGTGSGILAMAAARLLARRVLAVDNEPWSVRTAAQNAALNRLNGRMRCILSDGWRRRAVRAGGPYDLVFANILARPLCAMARGLAASLAPGGVVILSGLLDTQARMVLAAYRRQHLVLRFGLREGPWTTLVLAKGRA